MAHATDGFPVSRGTSAHKPGTKHISGCMRQTVLRGGERVNERKTAESIQIGTAGGRCDMRIWNRLARGGGSSHLSCAGTQEKGPGTRPSPRSNGGIRFTAKTSANNCRRHRALTRFVKSSTTCQPRRLSAQDVKDGYSLVLSATVSAALNDLATGGLGSEACREQQGCGDGAFGCKNGAQTAGFSEWERIAIFRNCGKQLQVIERDLLEVGCGGWI